MVCLADTRQLTASAKQNVCEQYFPVNLPEIGQIDSWDSGKSMEHMGDLGVGPLFSFANDVENEAEHWGLVENIRHL